MNCVVEPRPVWRARVEERTGRALVLVSMLNESQNAGLLRPISSVLLCLIQRLIGGIPAEIRSIVMRSLAERLLLTAAALPPADAPPGKAETEAEASILSLRAERLMAMGLIDEARALILASPMRSRDPDLVRLNVEALLLANDLGGACSTARRDAGRQLSTYWQRVAIFCQLVAGDKDGAQLGASVLADTPDFDDKAFLSIVDAMAESRPVRLESLPSPTALHLAMLRSANAPLPRWAPMITPNST